MLKRTSRLHALSALLRGRRTITAAKIAERLQVSERTVYRDIRALQDAGVPIEGEPGIGYRLSRTAEVPPITFTREEVEALVLGARMVATWADPALAGAAGAAMARIEAVVSEALQEVVVGAPLYAMDYRDAGPPPLLGVIREAIAESREVDLIYKDAGERSSERVVRPLGLFFWGQVWTLAAWCLLRRDFRTFRVDRIEAVAVGEVFREEPGQTLDDLRERIRKERA